jgi:hypothetical protein
MLAHVRGAAVVAAGVTALATTLTACGGALSHGETAFREGQYPEAKQTLAGLEDQSRGWTEGRRAEYALYRALTFAALGDRARAAQWLREAKGLEDAHRGSLSGEDARRLRIALDASDVR